MPTLPNPLQPEKAPVRSGLWKNRVAAKLRRFPLPIALHCLLLGLALAFFALHFIHLSADFPNHSPWMDWSKYTDEGWYGDGAIRHFLLGQWYVPGDFNPAVALPVWPVLEAILFRFTGVSLIAARALGLAVFGGILLASWILLNRSASPEGRPSLAASAAVALMAANPFCFVFTRLAILEPPLVLFTLLALLAAQSARDPAICGPGPKTDPRARTNQTRTAIRLNLLPILALGVLAPLMVLTKTTGVFLLPAVAWMLYASLGHRPALLLRVGLPAALLGASLWLGYFLIVVRPHFLLDYQYLFSANAYTGISGSNFFSVLWYTLHGAAWMGRVLFLAAIVAVTLALGSIRRLKHHPVLPALLLWAFGYAAFLAYHNNLQPRYYFVIAVPLTLLVPVAFRDLVLPRSGAPRAAKLLAVIVFAAIFLPDAVQTIRFVRHPQYTFVNAARQIRGYIAAGEREQPTHSPLILSISGSDLSLMTGLRSICDDFGTAELADRVKQYNPGWYVSWNLIEDDKMDALSPQFHLERVATFPAMDDPDRNLLVLYRLDPAASSGVRPRRNRREYRRFRGRLGQAPSALQLEH